MAYKPNPYNQPVTQPPRLIPTQTRSGVSSMWDWSDKSVERDIDTNKNNMRQYNLDMQHAQQTGQLPNPAYSGSGIAFGGGAPAGGGGFNFGSAVSDIPSPSQTNYTNPYEARLNALLDNPDSISSTGAYKFRFNQGQQALERSAAAKGMTGSGNTLAALLQYGQGQAAQAYGDERDALAGLVGQRNQFNLGQRGADTAAYSAQTGRAGTLGDLALGGSRLGLEAQKAQADDYWSGQNYKLKQQELAQRGFSGAGSRSSSRDDGAMQLDRRGFW